MTLDRVKAYLLLGSNLGNREKYIAKALELIGNRIGEVTAQSAIYETAAWGNTNQPGFLNLALEVRTVLEPLALLDAVLAIEQDLGRVRHEKWGARLIDIDIVLYGEEIINLKERLQIPHPEMQNRKFVLQPLVEIAPMAIHPVIKQDIKTILAGLDDPLSVEKR